MDIFKRVKHTVSEGQIIISFSLTLITWKEKQEATHFSTLWNRVFFLVVRKWFWKCSTRAGKGKVSFCRIYGLHVEDSCSGPQIVMLKDRRWRNNDVYTERRICNKRPVYLGLDNEQIIAKYVDKSLLTKETQDSYHSKLVNLLKSKHESGICFVD